MDWIHVDLQSASDILKNGCRLITKKMWEIGLQGKSSPVFLRLKRCKNGDLQRLKEDNLDRAGGVFGL